MPKSGRAYFNENTPHLKLVGAKPPTFKSIYLRDGAVVLALSYRLIYSDGCKLS